jgi:hypothetical protein
MSQDTYEITTSNYATQLAHLHMESQLETPQNTPRPSRLYQRRKSICVELPPIELIAPIVSVPDCVPALPIPTSIKTKRRHTIGGLGTPRPQNNLSSMNKNLIQLAPMGASPVNTLDPVQITRKRPKSMLAYVPGGESGHNNEDIATADLMRFLQQMQVRFQ